MIPFDGIRACVFDAYGTLFDFASASQRCADALGSRAAELSALWRHKQLQYTWLRGLQNRHADFWQVTGDALDYAMDTLGIRDAGLRERLMHQYLEVEAFPEVPESLRRLKHRGLRTAILSNGTPAMLHAAVKAAGIGDRIDRILSVEDVQTYKPSPRVYQLAVDHLELAPASMVFFSSNAWDAWAASAFGLRVVWCNRYQERGERLPGAPDCEVRNLSGVADLFKPQSR